jgi:GTP-binding nuclear protein Ran
MDIINIAIVGDMAVGKTAYLTRHLTGDFVKSHVPNPGTQYTIPVETNQGHVICQVTEGLDDYQAVDGIMVMFDVTNKVSFNNSIELVQVLCVSYPDIPIVWLGNKVDSRDRKVQWKDINKSKRTLPYSNLKYYDLSARSNYNFEKPFLRIINRYHPDLKSVTDSIPLPEIDWDQMLLAF